MVRIAEYFISEPPTSEEVYRKALDYMTREDPMVVTLEPDFDFPKNPVDVDFVVEKIARNSTITGRVRQETNPNMQTISITLAENLGERAIASVVLDD